MARDTGRSPSIQKKLFGPFNGLNGTQSPFLRELPPSPNAKPAEFATEFLNLIQNQNTQELVSRYGIEFVEKGGATAPAISATAGLFKWIDYDTQTGKPRERLINLVVDEDGLPTVIAYRYIKTQLRVTDASLDGKRFAIIEDTANSYAKRFVVYNDDGTVFASYSTLAGVTNTSVTYVDYDADRDGAFILGAVDLLAPVTLTYSASDGTPATVAEFWSLCKKETEGTTLDLTDWLDTLDTEDAAFWTATQNQNVLYFSGGGVCPQLKYDGQSLVKAGAPHAASKGALTFTKQTYVLGRGPEDIAGTSIINGVLEGLMNPSSLANQNFLGNFVYVHTYEIGDAKGNYIEGEAYLPGSYTYVDSLGAPQVDVNVRPKYIPQTELLNNAGVVSGDTYRYSAPSLRGSDGYGLRGAYGHYIAAVTISQSGSTTVTVDGSLYPGSMELSPGDKFYISSTNPSSLLERGYYTVGTVISPTSFTYTAPSSLTHSGPGHVSKVYLSANVASNFTIGTFSAYNNLKAGDIFCIRALILTDTTASDETYRFPVLITGRLSAVASSSITVDKDYPITIEIVPGGDHKANALSGLLSNITSDTQLALQNELTSIKSWESLAAWDWLGLSTYTKIVFDPRHSISNNIRINVYRNKANANENNSYDPTGNDTDYVPLFYLHNIFPNDPFISITSIDPFYDNCKDSCLGRPLENKQPLLVEGKGINTKDFGTPSYTTLPKGKFITSYKGRNYVSDDPENSNILHRSSLLYGPEYYDVSDTLSMETPVGDEVKAIVGNDEALFVLKDNSVKIIINDLENNRIRIDDFTIGDDGCIAPRSAVPLENGVAYLTNNGPAWVQVNKQIAYLGENNNGVSRIKDRLTDPELDLKRAVASVDTDKQLYQLYVPRVTKPSAGLYNPTDLRHSDNPYYMDDGVMFVFDYANDAWYEQSGINAKGGMIFLEQSGGGRNMYLTQYAKNTSESESTLEWSLYKDRKYGNLWSYADRLERDGTEELRPIYCIYGTDWLAMDDPNELKKWLRCKIYAIRSFDDLHIKNTAGHPFNANGEYNLTVQAYPNWREDKLHSEAEVTLNNKNLFAFIKCRNMHSQVMKFKIVHETLFSSPRIQAIEIEATSPFKAKMKPWGVP